jgi:ElaB/YqjD/DUF883 family membrane-anchored ribosome-binding protein
MITSVEQEAEALKKDIGKFRDDLGRALSDIGSFSRDKLVETRDKLKRAAYDFENAAEERFGHARDIIRDKGEKAVTSSRHVVQKKPFTAIAVAFAAGMLSAILMERHAR